MGWKSKALKGILFFLLILCSACNFGENSRKVDPLVFLHDNSSKVWQIEHCTQNGVDYVPVSQGLKNIITFFDSGNAYVQRMGTLGDEVGERARVKYHVQKKELTFYFSDTKWKFSIVSDQNNRIELQTLSKKEFPYDLVLIPLAEPKN